MKMRLGRSWGVDVADNEDAWDALPLEDDDNYVSDFEMKSDNSEVSCHKP
jgi:hypothetical protein